MYKRIILICFCFLFFSCAGNEKIKIENFFATQDYNKKNFSKAIEKLYGMCINNENDLQANSVDALTQDYIKYNLALCYLVMGESSEARKKFEDLTQSNNEKIKALAYFQLGVKNFKEKKYSLALKEFKNSIRLNSNFNEAKINYETCMKLLNNKTNTKDKIVFENKIQIQNENTILNYIREKEIKKCKEKENQEKIPYDY